MGGGSGAPASLLYIYITVQADIYKQHLFSLYLSLFCSSLIQVLVDQILSTKCPGRDRLKLFYAVSLPPKWTLEVIPEFDMILMIYLLI